MILNLRALDTSQLITELNLRSTGGAPLPNRAATLDDGDASRFEAAMHDGALALLKAFERHHFRLGEFSDRQEIVEGLSEAFGPTMRDVFPVMD